MTRLLFTLCCIVQCGSIVSIIHGSPLVLNYIMSLNRSKSQSVSLNDSFESYKSCLTELPHCCCWLETWCCWLETWFQLKIILIFYCREQVSLLAHHQIVKAEINNFTTKRCAGQYTQNETFISSAIVKHCLLHYIQLWVMLKKHRLQLVTLMASTTAIWMDPVCIF